MMWIPKTTGIGDRIKPKDDNHRMHIEQLYSKLIKKRGMTQRDEDGYWQSEGALRRHGNTSPLGVGG